MKTLIKNPWIVTMNENFDIIRDGYVLIEDTEIKEVGKDALRMDLLAAEADKVVEAKNFILMPGIVNSHSHMFQTFMRGLADDKHLFPWLSEEVWPFAALMTKEDFYYAGLIGSLENLKTGATGVLDQHYIHTDPTNDDEIFRAMDESGIRGNLCRTFANMETYYYKFRETEDAILDEIKRLHAEWHGKRDGRLSLSAGAINSWACTPELFRSSKALTKELGLKYQVHTSEDEDVVIKTAKMYDGLRNVELFEKFGILDEDTSLAHAIWLNDEEIDIVARTGAMVVHCPVANAYLADGIARIPDMRKKGITVALATDGPGSNNSQEMLGTLKYTACLHKVNTLDSQVFSNRDILEMACHGGAHTIGMEKSLGVIAPGYKADMVLVDYKKPHISPVHKADSALVYNANGCDVDTVIVNGDIVVQGGKSTKIDEAALYEECQKRIEYIKSQM